MDIEGKCNYFLQFAFSVIENELMHSIFSCINSKYPLDCAPLVECFSRRCTNNKINLFELIMSEKCPSNGCWFCDFFKCKIHTLRVHLECNHIIWDEISHLGVPIFKKLFLLLSNEF